jgi:hypothetical protein
LKYEKHNYVNEHILYTVNTEDSQNCKYYVKWTPDKYLATILKVEAFVPTYQLHDGIAQKSTIWNPTGVKPQITEYNK